MEFNHVPVMAAECIEALDIKENGIYVDGTAGGGSHSELIAQRLANGRLICIDRDNEALSFTKDRLKVFDNIIYVHDNFINLAAILESNNIGYIDGILLDLGVSSYQIDNAQRGFSYLADKFSVIDMRMDQTCGMSGYDVVNGYSEKELTDIFFKYGEEKHSRRIASLIVERRQVKPIETTLELARIIEEAIPARERHKNSHPAKRVFQAVRIEVNDELSELSGFIKSLPALLNSKGRISVITFHSLEDRIVKRAFSELQTPCVCPPDLPICVCGRKSEGKTVYKKPVIPSKYETEHNPRSKSAKLRAFEKN